MTRARDHNPAACRAASWCLGLLALLVVLPSGGCSESQGSIQVTAYGESFIEEGIPASDMDDGWAVTFARFVVTLRDIQVAGETLPDPDPVDLTQPSNGLGQALGSVTTATGAHTDAGFTVARVEVEGEATTGTETKTFSWTFDHPQPYAECETITTVTADETATFQITIHADHLFYNSLVSHEPALFFQALADADGDGDGEITQAELAATDIGAYDAGSEGGIDDLWSWLVALTSTLGHVDGEGHCHPVASDL